MSLVQLHSERLSADRVPSGERPVYEIHLEDHQRIVAVTNHWVHDPVSRKTEDHSVTVWVETRL